MPERLADLLAGLSREADLGYGLEAGTAQSSSVLASWLARSLGCSDDEVRAAYYTALLHHVGCVGYAHETAKLFEDELVANRAAARTDAASARDLVVTFLPILMWGRPPVVRLRLLANALTRGAVGRPVGLLGHSYSGNVAFGAALRTRNLRRLALYEGWPVPDLADRTIAPELTAALDALLDQGKPEQMLETFYRDVVHMSDEEVRLIKASPAWPARVAAAPTVPRELRAFSEQAFDPAQASRITGPVLLLVGGDTPDDIRADPEMVMAALPDARMTVLPGQMHLAHLTDPGGFADALLGFLDED